MKNYILSFIILLFVSCTNTNSENEHNSEVHKMFSETSIHSIDIFKSVLQSSISRETRNRNGSINKEIEISRILFIIDSTSNKLKTYYNNEK